MNAICAPNSMHAMLLPYLGRTVRSQHADFRVQLDMSGGDSSQAKPAAKKPNVTGRQGEPGGTVKHVCELVPALAGQCMRA
jgi:hypothetical protein